MTSVTTPLRCGLRMSQTAAGKARLAFACPLPISLVLIQPPLQILKRKVLSTIAEPDSAVKRAKKKARRSLGRRVSFAPDAELETRHLYEKVSPPSPPPRRGSEPPQHEPTYTTCPSPNSADGAAATPCNTDHYAPTTDHLACAADPLCHAG